MSVEAKLVAEREEKWKERALKAEKEIAAMWHTAYELERLTRAAATRISEERCDGR